MIFWIMPILSCLVNGVMYSIALGKEFDITASFEALNTTKYISDGNKNNVVIPNDKELSLGTTNKNVIKY